MKIRTKLIISFLLILIVPVCLTLVAVSGFSRIQQKAIANKYGIENSETYHFTNSVQILNRVTASNFEELLKAMDTDKSVFEDEAFLLTQNEKLSTKFSYLVVCVDDKVTFNGGKDNSLVLSDLEDYIPEDRESMAGAYFDSKNDILVKQASFDFPDGREGEFYIITSTKGVIPEIKRLILECCVAICCILVITALLLIVWIYRSMIIPIKKLQQGVENIKEGNLDFEIHASEDDEIGELCVAFEGMRERLKENAEEKLHNESESRALISNIAHDLKTPITAVKGYAEGIIDGVANTPEKVEKYIRTIYNKANEMDTLINELTLYSKIDSNRIPYNFAKIAVSDYFNDCIEEVGLDLESKGIRLAYTNYVTEDTLIIADPEQLRRVVNNIIGNSVKYMDKPDGFINFRIKDVGDFIQVEIEDNGRGIAPMDLPYIFERFFRADASRNSMTGGSGIGLSIVKKIVEDHGGKIWATSKEGTGTIIYFVIRKYQEVINE